MNYFPSLETLSKQTIITVVSIVAAGFIISQFPFVKKFTSQIYSNN